MSRPRGKARALGPYRHRNGFQVIEVASDGSREYRPFTDEDEAREYVKEFNAIVTTVGATLGEALEKYRHEFITIRGNKPASWPETRRRIVALVGGLEVELDTVTARRASEAYAALVGKFAADTHRGMLTHTKTFFAWAVKARLAEANPFADVMPVGKKRRGKPKLRRDEARAFAAGAFRLLAEAPDRVRFERYLIGLTALYLGARASEITTRQVRDIDDDCSLYVIPDAKTPAGVRRERIPKELRPWFRTLIAGRPGNAPLFAGRCHKRGRTHEQHYVTRYCVVPLCKALGLPRVTAHGLRGTFADLAAEEGVASLAVARSLGHAGEAVTRAHYLGAQALADGVARKAHEVLNPSPPAPSETPTAAKETDPQDPENTPSL